MELQAPEKQRLAKTLQLRLIEPYYWLNFDVFITVSTENHMEHNPRTYFQEDNANKEVGDDACPYCRGTNVLSGADLFLNSNLMLNIILILFTCSFCHKSQRLQLKQVQSRH